MTTTMLIFTLALLISFGFSETAADCGCTINGCRLGIDLLQYTYGPNLSIGELDDNYHVDPNASFGSVLPIGLFSTSQYPFFIKSNRVFDVPCQDDLQLTTMLTFQEDLLQGPIDSPFGYQKDPFYGYGSAGFIDEEQGLIAEFRITGGMVYAAYGRIPPPANECCQFLYLIPVIQTNGTDCAGFQVSLEACTKTISYRIGGVEVLRLKLDQVIDPKFEVYGFNQACTCQQSQALLFPAKVRVRLGNAAMVSVDCCSSTNGHACQGAIFQECFDNVSQACRVQCQYSNTTQALDTFNIGLASSIKSVTIIQGKQVAICEGGCSSSSTETTPCDSDDCARDFECGREQRARWHQNQVQQLQ